MKLTSRDIDKIIEESLTNINLQDQSQDSSKELDTMIEPVFQYLDSEENQEKIKVQDVNKMKNFIKDPIIKKAKDVDIKNSQLKLKQINQTRDNLMLKNSELKKQAIESQKSLEQQMMQLKKNAEMVDLLKTRVQETYDNNYTLPILKRTNMLHLDSGVNENIPTQNVHPAPVQKKPTFKVKFEGSTPSAFEVVFSERGFKIGETRLSFETIEDALSKNFIITLDNGNGLVLDAVRMQKILRYKNKTT